ncbi:MAG TPA: hypothetical protein VFY75_07650 [Solirubrobacterales bacterium]|nr:hypothetical protein [Solirubrobacterales bacterium]
MRSAIGATIALLVLAFAWGSTAVAAPPQRVVLAWVPSDTTVAELAAAGFSPGIMSAGLGTVPAEQTYLDVGQGNRVFDSLYDRPLPKHQGDAARWWREVVERAESAPADIVPGLLASKLRSADPMARLEVRRSALRRLARPPGTLTIAIARPTGSDAPLPIGIAGPGFDGNLTSDSTRMDGYVLSTDVAPTILEYFGIETPGEMSGRPIRAQGAVDPGQIESLGDRMDVIYPRRGPVVVLPLVVWLLLTAGVALLAGATVARRAVRVLALSVVYLLPLLLLGAALEPGQLAEALLVGFGAPALALVTLALLSGYRAIGVASALTALAYVADMIAGSPLTSLSLLGPNPALGARFYGIGNELEAPLAVLVVAGTGAGLAGFAPRISPRSAAAVFVAAGLLAAFVFAAGRFGADVGAAIVFPVGAAVAAVAIAGRGRWPLVLAALAAPLAVLALLALIDLLSGADAHLTRSVLDAGGFGDLADVAQRRLQLSARSFAKPALLAFLPVVLGLGLLAYLRRDRLRSWLGEVPAVRAGLLGALAATVVGALANDSGLLLLEIGTAYLLVFTGYAWAERPVNSVESTASDEKLQLRAPHV